MKGTVIYEVHLHMYNHIISLYYINKYNEELMKLQYMIE